MEATALENLSKDELIHYQELFSIFDKEDSGHIPTSQFPIFVRGLGHCPTEAELKEMKTALDPNNEGKIPFGLFQGGRAGAVNARPPAPGCRPR